MRCIRLAARSLDLFGDLATGFNVPDAEDDCGATSCDAKDGIGGEILEMC